MNKMKIGQIIGLDLSWSNLTTNDVSAVLQAFDHEYVSVEYLDAKAGDYLTADFYVGDRSAPLYNAASGLWSNVSFSITKREGA
jgi:hypothetical protein